MPIKSHYNPTVFDRKTVFMQRIADFVRLGYREYVLNEVPADRAWPLAMKFRRLYEVHLHRNHRARLRAAGEASAYTLWWQPHADSVVFALLITPGSHAARQLERLRDATTREGRLTLGDYELVQRPRAKKPRPAGARPANPHSSCSQEGRPTVEDDARPRQPRAAEMRPAWTWRLTAEAYEGWRLRVLEVVRGGNEFVVQQLIDDLLAMPGFAGVREQVKKLKSLFRSEWKRRRGAVPVPTLPRQRFVQRLENRGKRLSEFAPHFSSACSERNSPAGNNPSVLIRPD